MLAKGWEVVGEFEQAMAEYTGAPYAVAVDSCTAALFLCFKRLECERVWIPCRTYLGVACAVIHAGAELRLKDDLWKGSYYLPVSSGIVVDSACRLNRLMYRRACPYGGFVCLSFQYRKHLKIGRGGMILTVSKEDADWFRAARFCGRTEVNGPPAFVGWHCFMEPERAARGLTLLQSLPDDNPDLCFEYPDLRTYDALKPHLVRSDAR